MTLTNLHVRKMYGALKHGYSSFQLKHILFHSNRRELKKHRLIQTPLIHYVIDNEKINEAVKCELINVLLEHGVGFD